MANYCTQKEVITTIKTAGGVVTEQGHKIFISRAITAYSRTIDKSTGRDDNAYIAPAASIRYFDGEGEQELLVDDMAAAPTEVAIAEAGDITDYTIWAATDYLVYPFNKTPYTSLVVDRLNGTKSFWNPYRKSVKITAQWGYSLTVPDQIKNACIVQVILTLKRAQKSYQDDGAVLEKGSATKFFKLDPEVEKMLAGLVKVAVI